MCFKATNVLQSYSVRVQSVSNPTEVTAVYSEVISAGESDPKIVPCGLIIPLIFFFFPSSFFDGFSCQNRQYEPRHSVASFLRS